MNEITDLDIEDRKVFPIALFYYSEISNMDMDMYDDDIIKYISIISNIPITEILDMKDMSSEDKLSYLTERGLAEYDIKILGMNFLMLFSYYMGGVDDESSES